MQKYPSVFTTLPVFTNDYKKETSSGKNVPVSRSNRARERLRIRMTLVTTLRVEESCGGTEGKEEGWLERRSLFMWYFSWQQNGSTTKEQTAIFMALLKQSVDETLGLLWKSHDCKTAAKLPTRPNRKKLRTPPSFNGVSHGVHYRRVTEGMAQRAQPGSEDFSARPGNSSREQAWRCFQVPGLWSITTTTDQ